MYSIKILSNKEFDRLPYKRAGEALGVADPETNTAFIRYTAHQELNKYLVDHEFDHLVEEIPTDEEDGVRYKIPIGSILPAIGGALKTGGGALLKGASQILPAIGSAFNSFGGGQTTSASGYSNLGRLGHTNFPGQLPLGAPVGGGFNTGFGRPVGGSSPAFGNPLSKFFGGGKGLLGTGLLTAGLLKPLPKAPPLPDSVNQLRSQIQSGGSPLGQQARSRLSGLLDQQFNPLTEPEIQAATRQLDLEQVKAEDQLRDLYRNIRPGSDPSSDTTFGKDLAEIQNRFATLKADTLATRTRETKQAFDVNQRLAIQQSLGASDQEIEQLSEIAQLDVYQIATQLGLDLDQAELFKNTFINLGSSLINPQPNLLSLFGSQ